MISSELQTVKSKVVTDDSTNGGRMSANIVTTGVVQNVWPHVTKAERTAGSTKYRKLFDKVANDDDEALINPGYYLDGDTQGEDFIVFAPGTQRDTQSDITGAGAPTRWYGAGTLKTGITADSTNTITIVMKDASITGAIGLAQELIRISNKDTPDAVTGTEDFMTCINAPPSVSGNEVTVEFTENIPHAYDAGAKISAVYEPGSDVEASISSVVDSSAIFDETQVSLDNIGTSEQDVTITFTSSSAFTVTMDDKTGLPSGDISTTYAPTESDFSKPILTIPPAAWVGTPTTGDEVTFTISPAAVPLWQKRDVPAGCASLANNYIRKVTIGESVS